MIKRFNGMPGVRWIYTRYRQFITGGVFLKTEECPADQIERYKKGANAMQVGGRHYKTLPIEPWDYIAANKLGFFEGNIVKYLTRAAKTGNRDDLLKAQHYLSKLLEITPIPKEEVKAIRSARAQRDDDQLTLLEGITVTDEARKHVGGSQER
jgi:uncharacterized protein DUF3310